jgi:hypothetical protein
MSCYFFSMSGQSRRVDCKKEGKGGGGFLNLHLSTASATSKFKRGKSIAAARAA